MSGKRAVLFILIFSSVCCLVIGCEGDTGDRGPVGPAGPPGTASAAGATGESCMVCHAQGKIADIALAHPDPKGMDVTLSNITLSNSSGVARVFFHAATAAGPVTNLVLNDFRFMIADLVPADTNTLGGWGTWGSPYFERWAYESPPSRYGTYPQGNLINLSGGDYRYVFATPFSDASIEAPDYNDAHIQRLAIVVSGHNDASGNAVTNNTVGFLDFTTPAGGGTVTTYASQRQFVTADACKKCHGEPFQQAAHADRYLDTRACVICHSPLGHYGDEMQEDSAYASVLFHKIHAAIEIRDKNTGEVLFGDQIRGLGYGAVTYPQDINDCVVCHTDSGLDLGTGDQIDKWKTNQTIEVCGSCHVDVNFATGENHPGGVQTNAECEICHLNGTSFSKNVPQAHDTSPTGVNIPEFNVQLNITPPANGSYYVAGEEPEVRVTLTDHADDYAVDPAIYTTPEDEAGDTGGGLHVASLYVYGPRAKSVPVLALETVTDPNFDSGADTPTQGHDLFLSADGTAPPRVTTDRTGFGYRLLPIPGDMAPGTYMVRVRIGDYGRVGSGDYHIESLAFTTIQIRTATVEAKAAGNACINCHGTGTAPFHDERHAVVFDTDQCLSCHDQSGNYAIPLANRLHAVHSANPEGDIYVLHGGSISSRDWSDITYPQNIQSPVTGHPTDDGLPRCVGCHTSDSNTYKSLAYMMPCVGCHASASSPVNDTGDIDHMRQNGGPY